MRSASSVAEAREVRDIRTILNGHRAPAVTFPRALRRYHRGEPSLRNLKSQIATSSSPTSGRAELNPGYETGSRVEIILSRLIDDAHLPMSFGRRVRQDLIQLARLQR